MPEKNKNRHAVALRRLRTLKFQRGGSETPAHLRKKAHRSAVALGKLGGHDGGLKAAEGMTATELRERAAKAGNARWEKWRKKKIKAPSEPEIS